MKKLSLIALMGIFLSSCLLAGCDFGKDDNNKNDLVIEEIDTDGVISYNDNLVEITSNCFASEIGMDEIYEAGNAEELGKAVQDVVDACNQSLKDLNKVGGWEGDTNLVDAVKPIIQLEIKYYEKIQELIPYQDIPQDEFTQEQADAYTAIEDELKAIDDEIALANDNLIKVQEQFAKDHNYELDAGDDEIDEENVIYIPSDDVSEDEEVIENDSIEETEE